MSYILFQSQRGDGQVDLEEFYVPVDKAPPEGFPDMAAFASYCQQEHDEERAYDVARRVIEAWSHDPDVIKANFCDDELEDLVNGGFPAGVLAVVKRYVLPWGLMSSWL